jgi:GNAT superfamily N-acetyltransferase
MIVIRKALLKDIAAIIDFQKRMAWETEKLTLNGATVTQGVKAIFQNPAHGQYFVSENDGTVIASLLITPEWSDWRNTEVWWFQSVYVLPEYRRSGIFRSMYAYVKEMAEKSDVAGLRLYVETNNHIAQTTYESLGMTGDHYRMYEWLRDY